MNTDRMAGAWKQLRGRIQEEWGKVTNDDLDRMNGQWDQLVGLIQSRYGKTRDEVEVEVKRFREQYDDIPDVTPGSPRPR